jgi:tetratricopeptide (TPR) repeat protein
MRAVASVLVLTTLFAGGVARADDPEAESARQHYKAATGHFAVGEFSAAAAEYEQAFKLHQDPALLFDAAQARRLAGENQKALVLYKNFLHLYPSSPSIPAVQEQIAKLQEAIAADSKAQTSPPTTTVEPGTAGAPPGTTQPAPAVQPAPAASAAAAPAPSAEKPPIYKKWWFWTAVGVVVVAAVVIPVAVVESRQQWNNLPPQGPGAGGAAARVIAVRGMEVRW